MDACMYNVYRMPCGVWRCQGWFSLLDFRYHHVGDVLSFRTRYWLSCLQRGAALSTPAHPKTKISPRLPCPRPQPRRSNHHKLFLAHSAPAALINSDGTGALAPSHERRCALCQQVAFRVSEWLVDPAHHTPCSTGLPPSDRPIDPVRSVVACVGLKEAQVPLRRPQ